MKLDSLLFNEKRKVTDITIPELIPVYAELTKKEGTDNLNDVWIWFIPNDSILMHALSTKWYASYEDALQHIRSAVEGTYHDEEGMFFVTGMGYDIISHDLLDRPADGKAKKEFLDKLNKD